MVFLVWLFLLAINATILTVYIKRIPRAQLWLSPPTYLLCFYTIHYPLRSILLLFEDRLGYGIQEPEVVLSLLYSTSFIGVLVGVYLWRIKSSDIRTNQGPDDGGRSLSTASKPLLVMLFGLATFAFLSRAWLGEFYALYESLEDLQRPFWHNALLSLAPSQWLFLCFALSTGAHRLTWVKMACAVVATLMALEGFLAASKGILVNLFIFVLIAFNWKGRSPNPTMMASGMALLISFAAYSYIARDRGQVRGEFSLSKVSETLDATLENQQDLRDRSIRKILDRFAYLDALALILRGSALSASEEYSAGSAVEVLNLIPRVLWSSRPHYSYNHYVTYAVWGLPTHFSETPVGRIGESAHVLGWFGIAAASLYGVVFAAIRRLATRGPIVSGIALTLIFLYCIPDATALYNFKLIVQALLILAGSLLLVRLILAFAHPRQQSITDASTKPP